MSTLGSAAVGSRLGRPCGRQRKRHAILNNALKLREELGKAAVAAGALEAGASQA
jgi:hypothetical protein